MRKRKGKRKSAPKHARFQARETKPGVWRFRVLARNGKQVGPTEAFDGSPSKIRRAIETHTRAVKEAARFPIQIVSRAKR